MDKIYKIIAQTVRFLSKLVGKKGTDLPGKVLRKINPKILNKLSKNFYEIIFITGTNGKTTTSNLIGHTLKNSGYNIVNNSEGANMLDGIISTFAIHKNKKTKIAVIEIDEGSIKNVMQYITPTKFVFNNFFRDQIDRFGEIDTLISTIGKQLENKKIQLILNSDDPFVTRLSKYGTNNIYFGVDKNTYEFQNVGITESKFCPLCLTKLNYDCVHYSQLGHYKCEKCEFKRPEPNYNVTFAEVNPIISLSINNGEKFSTSQLGDFNIYNILSAYSTLSLLGLKHNEIVAGFNSYSSNNGRMQIIKKDNKNILLNLAKNPAGMNVSLNIANSIDKEVNYLLVLNDNGADGFDISWIWDSEFEILKTQNIKNIICSGKRAQELVLRLKYADIDSKIFLENNIKKAVKIFKNIVGEYNIAIANYTALAETQKELEDE